jgi:hypothetical protein
MFRLTGRLYQCQTKICNVTIPALCNLRTMFNQYIIQDHIFLIQLGILLSGMGGMGKTCLANAVCYDMRREDWNTTKVELR